MLLALSVLTRRSLSGLFTSSWLMQCMYCFTEAYGHLSMLLVTCGFHSLMEHTFLEHDQPCGKHVNPSTFYYEVFQKCFQVKTSLEHGSSLAFFNQQKSSVSNNKNK